MPTIVMTPTKREEKQPYQQGDRLETRFFENRPVEQCTVTRCYPTRNCESGWLVDTIMDNGFTYKGRDSHWFNPIEDLFNPR